MSKTRTDGRDIPDPYAVLGIDVTASAAEIRAAHRRLVMRIHPDRNPHPAAAQQFHRVQQAYKLLSDPVRRSALDGRRRRQQQAEAERRASADAAATAAQAYATVDQHVRPSQREETRYPPSAGSGTGSQQSWRQPRGPVTNSEPVVVSAEEATEWLADQLRDLGPPPPSPPRVELVDLRLVASWVTAAVAASVGISMMITDRLGIAGGLLLLCAPLLPWVAHRTATRRR